MVNIEDIYKFLAKDDIQRIINNRDYNKLYYELAEYFDDMQEFGAVGKVTTMLMEVGENPLKYMNTIPMWYLVQSNIKAIEIPNNITTIDEAAFAESSLKSIVIPNQVTRLGVSAFESCNNLTSVKIGSGIKIIEEQAFYSCINLTDVELNNGLTTLEETVFGECVKLKKIILPQTMEHIYNSVFEACDSLKEIYIPGSIKKIHSDAFYGLEDLIIHFSGTKEAFIDTIYPYKGLSNITGILQCSNGEFKLERLQ